LVKTATFAKNQPPHITLVKKQVHVNLLTRLDPVKF
jgi:hypothetical protein